MTNNTTAALTNEQSEAARKRVAAFLDAYSILRGADQEKIHSINFTPLLVADLRALLTSPRAAALPDVIEAIASQWDECMFAGIGYDIDIGASIRDAYRRLDAAPAAPVAVLSEGDAANLITIDRRDLYGFMRGSIKRALEDASHGAAESHEPMSAVDCWSEAHTRTMVVFDNLKIDDSPVPSDVPSTDGGRIAAEAVPADGAFDFSAWLATKSEAWWEDTSLEKIAEDAWNASRAAVSPATAEKNEWKDAVDAELATIQSTADSYAGPKEAVKALIDWHVQVALDPAVSAAARSLQVATADTPWKTPKQHCQNGGDVCLAGNRDGVCCPEDSCDIDDGTRKNPATADERAAFVSLIGYERPETEGCAVDVWDSHRATWSAAIEFARASQAAAPQANAPDEMPADDLVGFVYVVGNPDRPHDPITRFSRRPLGVKSLGAKILSLTPVYSRPEQAAAPAEAREPAIEKYLWELVDEARRWESAYRDSSRRYETLDPEKNSVERTIRFIVSLFPTMVRPSIEYRYTGGTAWCDLGSAETMRADFDGVYRLKAGEFPVWNGDVPAEAGGAVAKPRDCSGTPESCPDNEGYGCHCSNAAAQCAQSGKGGEA